MAVVGLDRLSENCYVRVAFPIVAGVVSILVSFQDRKKANAFADTLASAIGIGTSTHRPKKNPLTPLQATAISVANLAFAIILSMIAFRYPESHEGLKKHVLVFSTFAMSTGFAGLVTSIPKTVNIFNSVFFATLLTVVDSLAWK